MTRMLDEKEARWENIQLRFRLLMNINGTINPDFKTTNFFRVFFAKKTEVVLTPAPVQKHSFGSTTPLQHRHLNDLQGNT